MPLVSSSIPNLINGVSQQPPALRLESQAEAVVNCMPSSVEGLKKRPPFSNVAKLFSGTAGTGRPLVTAVDRDGSVRYIVVITDGDLKVFGLDGAEQTVAFPDGKSYLDVANTSDPANKFRLTSIADYSFINNREKTVAMDSATSPTFGTKSIVFIKAANLNTTYTVTLNGTAKTYTTPTAGSGTASTVTIASQLASSLNTISGFTVTSSEYIIRITKDDGGDYTLESTDDTTGADTKAVKATVDGITDLPTRAEHGHIVKVQGTTSTALDDYYVRFELSTGTSGFGEGIWRETVAPGIVYKFDAATMPHVLVRESNGSFTFKKHTWSNRIAGDATTASNPSFVGQVIQNINVFRNRLVFLADEKIILSAAADYGRFWPETVQTVIDSDPIDLNAGGTDINILVSSLSFANTLLLFSRIGQFRLDTGSSGVAAPLTPKTATITAMTRFEMDDSVDPIGVGRTVFFPIPKGDFSGLREYFLPDVTGSVPDTSEVTASVPRYIPTNLSTLISSVSEEAIILLSKDQAKRIYLYKFLFEEDQKLQSAWSYWEVKGAKTIVGAFTLDTDVYMLAEYSDGVYLEKASLRPENVDSGTSLELLLDRKATEASCTIAVTNPGGLGAQSTVTLPYPMATTGTMAVVGRYDTGAYSDEQNFPTSAPSNGTAVSIRNAGGLSVNGSGVATNARTTGNSSDNVTINGFPSHLWSKSIGEGVGLAVTATSTAHTYTYQNLITIRHGQVIMPTSETLTGGAGSKGTMVVLGDLTGAKFYVGELYDMTYEFSTPYVKEQPRGGGVAIAAGPYLQMRNWAVIFDETSAFELKITPAGRDPQTYPYNGISLGTSPPLLGSPSLETGSFRVPVMARNTDTKVEIVSSSPLPCRFQSAEWEGWYHTRTRRV